MPLECAVSCEWLEPAMNTAALRGTFCLSPQRRLMPVLLLSTVGGALPAACQNKESATVKAKQEFGVSFARRGCAH